MTNFAWRFSGRLALNVHRGRSAPDAEAWAAMIAEVRKLTRVAELRVLVYGEGGMPSASQRDELLGLLAGQAIPTAILTKGLLARVIGYPLAIFNPQLRFFASHRVDRAFHHLGLRERERTFALRAIAELCAEIGLRWEPPADAAGASAPQQP